MKRRPGAGKDGSGAWRCCRASLSRQERVTAPTWERTEGKIQCWHRDRLAAVYQLSEPPAGFGRSDPLNEPIGVAAHLAERCGKVGDGRQRVLIVGTEPLPRGS